jgi:hypothetical protein
MRMRARGRGESKGQEDEQQDASGHGRHNIMECGLKVACNIIAVTRS